MSDGKPKPDPKDVAKKLFHELWGRDVGSPGYDKRKWGELQTLLAQLGINL